MLKGMTGIDEMGTLVLCIMRKKIVNPFVFIKKIPTHVIGILLERSRTTILNKIKNRVPNCDPIKVSASTNNKRKRKGPVVQLL